MADRLARFGKRLASTHIERLVDSGTFTNPLYATTLLDELRVEADHAHLDETIEHYLRAGDVAELLDLVLARLEGDYDRDRPGLVSDALRISSAPPAEDSKRTSCSTCSVSTVSALHADSGRHCSTLPPTSSPTDRAGSASPSSRPGSLSTTATCRLPFTGRTPTGRWPPISCRSLADARTLDELPWQYAQAEQWDELADLLRRPDVLVALWHDDPASIHRYWSDIETAVPGRLLDTYRHVLDNQVWESDAIAVVSELFRRAGHVDRGLSAADHAHRPGPSVR